MSKEFYNYLAKKVIDYFNAAGVKNGDRFDIQFEKEDEVKDLYDQIKIVREINIFNYKAAENVEEYKTISFKVLGIDIIVAATIDGIQPDYLTKLRNEVGGNENDRFRNTAILFIHNTTLDSIIGGATSFKREGMPFHIGSIIDDIKSDLENSQLTSGQKNIIAFELERNNSSNDEVTSLLQFEELLKVINKGVIEKKDYKSFGLFFDNQLEDFSGNELRNRIKENAENFSKVDTIHKFQGDIPTALERFLDEKGVDLLSDPKTWEELDFSTIQTSIENKKKTKKVQFEGYDLSNIEQENFWDKPNQETAAGNRKRRIIIFNPNNETKLQFFIKFDERISQMEVSSDKGQEAIAKASGKKIKVEIEHEIGKVSFNTVKLKASENYEFKIVIIDLINSIFKDSEIQTAFNIGKENVITLNTRSSVLTLNEAEVSVENYEINENKEEIYVESLDSKIVILNKIDIDENMDYIRLNLNIKGVCIPLAIKDEGHATVPINGYSVWIQKREERKDFKYIDNKLVQGSRTYYPKEDFKANLKREEQIINGGSLFFVEKSNELHGENLEVSEVLREAYASLINYYRVNQLLPSLVYFNEELSQLSYDYVNEFIKAINNLEEGGYVKSIHRDLVKVGTVKVEDGENRILLTPLHPINVMYQMEIQKQVESERLHESLAKKLESLYLLPYVAEYKTLYKPIEQSHSKEWKYYVKNNDSKYKSSRGFIEKLVKEKIEEFVQHFSYLFQFSSKAAIKINLINTGDSKEILQGIIGYYISELKKNSRISDLKEVCINIYSDEDTNIFEELSFYETVNQVEDNLKLNLEPMGIGKDYIKEDILSICREKIKFYRKNIKSEIYEYCHITFYEMDQNVGEKDSKTNDMITGVSLNGIVSGVPSKFINNSYRTGFGNRYMDNSEGNLLLRVSDRLNSLYRSVENEVSYTKLECRTTVISEQDNEKLDKIYNSSNWVTFIEPKVDLKFFKNDAADKGLLIIHYSDQYTSSSGYDSITVTRKSEQYELIIKEYMRDKHVNITENSVVDVINCFNAFNGDWLLRLISSNGQFPREKISIISAVKLSMAYFYHENIIWIPISLEEVLRVSKGAGLSGADGLFSVRNLRGEGQYSDDLLLMGIEICNEELIVHYYPIEVKIGDNSSTVINKAKKQAYKTRNYLEKHLVDIDGEEETRKFGKKMYRNFMMQLAIISAEKMKLYDIWEEQNWDLIIDSDVRRKLLNDDYKIVNNLDELIGRGAVMSFKKGIMFNDQAKEIEVNQDELEAEYDEEEFAKGNKFLEIIFGESQGYNNIIKPMESIKKNFVNGESDFEKEKLLSYKYCGFTSKEDHTEVKFEGIKEDINGSNKANTEGVKEEAAEAIEYKKSESQIDIVKEPLTILFGSNAKTGEEIKWFPTDTSKVMHSNTGIIGTMGTGKTQFTKSLIYQLNQDSYKNVNGKKIGLLIFDYKGDYIDTEFKESTNAKVLNIYKLPYNPLALVKGSQLKPLLPLHTANSLKETISKAFNLGIKQETLLRDIMMEAYERRGINKAKQDTWDRLPPTLNEVCELYLNNEDVAQDSLYAALKNLYEFDIFESDPVETKSLFDIIDGVTVINLSGYDQGIQNLVVAITLDIFYSQMLTIGESKMEGQHRQLTNMVLVDEADNFLRKNFDSLRKILKEGRMFGVGTILSTQLLSHFSTGDNEYANYILTWIVHNVSDLNNKDVRFIFNTKGKDEEEVIYNKIKSLEKHHSLIKLGGNKGAIYVRDKAFWEIFKG